MTKNIKLIVYPAGNLDASKALFNKFLGVEPYVDGGYYVGYKVGDLEVGLDPSGQEVVAYTDVDDIHTGLQELLDSGATIHQDVKEVGGGLLIAQVKDANGNVVGIRAQK